MQDWFFNFIHQDQIYIVNDNDSAGLFGAIRTAKILGVERCKIYTFSDFEEKGYDANDWFTDKIGDGKAFMQMLEEKSKFSFELENKRRK